MKGKTNDYIIRCLVVVQNEETRRHVFTPFWFSLEYNQNVISMSITCTIFLQTVFKSYTGRLLAILWLVNRYLVSIPQAVNCLLSLCFYYLTTSVILLTYLLRTTFAAIAWNPLGFILSEAQEDSKITLDCELMFISYTDLHR